MSLELYSLIPGQQVKRDRDLSNVTIQCDPLAVYPDNNAAGNRFKPGEAGKLAVEDEICDLTINGNLEVKGKLKLNGSITAEICNIFCPNDFNLVAGGDSPQGNVNITAYNDISLLANGPGFGDITISTAGSTDGNITVTAEGNISMSEDGDYTVACGGNMDISTNGAASTLSINTESQVVNAIHLHIPTGTGGAPSVADQINIQNQYNTNARSVQIKSDLGGVYVESGAGTTLQINPGGRLKFFNAAGAGGAPSNPGTAAAGNVNDAVINAITDALIAYGLFN